VYECHDFTEVPKDEGINDEQIAALALKRTVNQAWKQRFADIMKTLDEKDGVRATCIRTCFARINDCEISRRNEIVRKGCFFGST
jgi:hypothetical protein